VPDPWEVLGLTPGAPLAEARAARRRLAKQLHPDAHAGRDPQERAALERRMVSVNQALAAIVAERGPSETRRPGAAAGAGERRGPPVPGPAGDEHDGADDGTFSMEALPVRAFEELFVAAYALGEVLDDDEPYLLDVYLRLPEPCFCRIELVPDAGASTVTLSVASAEGHAVPPVTAVRDALIAELDALWTREGPATESRVTGSAARPTTGRWPAGPC
jgi:hypothetical protein